MSFLPRLVLLFSLCASLNIAQAQESQSTEADINPSPTQITETNKNKLLDVVMHSMSYIGVRYKYGGSSPETGFDCSGLVNKVYRDVLGMALPRRASDISQVGQHIGENDLEPGDLVFYNTLGKKFSHVGIYLGNNRFVHAPSSGGSVRVEQMEMSYWKKRFSGARRLLTGHSDKN